MNINTIRQDFLQDVNAKVESTKRSWVPTVTANAAKFARAFYNLCNDLGNINPANASALFGDSDFHAGMREVALATRAVADPQHYGDTRERVDQIRKEFTSSGAERGVMFNPRIQREMVNYLCGTLVSNGVLENLVTMQAILLSFVGEIPLSAHRELIQNIIDSLDKFASVAENMRALSNVEETCSNPRDLYAVRACANSLKEAILASDHIKPERKVVIAQTMQSVDAAYPFTGEYSEFGDATVALGHEIYKLSFLQSYCMEPLNDVLAVLTDALARLDNEIYYPAIRAQN
jgi:hypothetical protein